MAKIVRFHEIGGPEVLKIEEGPSREPHYKKNSNSYFRGGCLESSFCLGSSLRSL